MLELWQEAVGVASVISFMSGIPFVYRESFGFLNWAMIQFWGDGTWWLIDRDYTPQHIQQNGGGTRFNPDNWR